MTRPGTIVASRATAPPRSSPTDTSVWFPVGATSKGPAVPTLVQSFDEYQAQFGVRPANVDMFDAVDAFFREGGSRCVVTKLGADPATIDDALALVDRALGPGQVSAPGQSDPLDHVALLAHAATHNRIAILDADPAADAATLEGDAATLRALDTARYGALETPTVTVPPAAGGVEQRVVGFSGLQAGMIARSDALYGPNVAAAGQNGVSRYATGVGVVYTDAEREALNAAGVNVARLIFGQVCAYGYRTLADPATGWSSLGNARLNMAIVAKAEAIAEHYLFSQMDGQRKTIAAFGGDLMGMLIPFYDQGALYGETASDAFYVDVGNQVNTDATIANGELRAVIACRMSPFAELVTIEIVKTAITETL